MNYVNEPQAAKDAESIMAAISLMCEHAKPVINDGINISVTDLYNIAIGRKSLASIFQKEAEERSKSLPAYRKEQEISEAVNRSNNYQGQVNELRNYMIIAKFKPESFKMDPECNVSYVGNLKQDCTALNTKALNKKQEKLVEGIEMFSKALAQFNELLTEAGKVKLKIEIPFTNHLGDPDLKEIAFVNHQAIEEKQNSIERQIKADIEKKEKIRLRIESLVPKKCDDREETVNRFILHELTTPREDEFYKNLLNPSKGNFKSKGVTSIGRIYEQ